MANASRVARIAEHSEQMLEDDMIGHRIAQQRMQNGESYLDLVTDRRKRQEESKARVTAFRESYFYPALMKQYGEVAVRGAMERFKNPRHIEDMIVLIQTGKSGTPLCDEWDAAGMRYEAEEFDL